MRTGESDMAEVTVDLKFQAMNAGDVVMTQDSTITYGGTTYKFDYEHFVRREDGTWGLGGYAYVYTDGKGSEQVYGPQPDDRAHWSIRIKQDTFSVNVKRPAEKRGQVLVQIARTALLAWLEENPDALTAAGDKRADENYDRLLERRAEIMQALEEVDQALASNSNAYALRWEIKKGRGK